MAIDENYEESSMSTIPIWNLYFYNECFIALCYKSYCFPEGDVFSLVLLIVFLFTHHDVWKRCQLISLHYGWMILVHVHYILTFYIYWAKNPGTTIILLQISVSKTLQNEDAYLVMLISKQEIELQCYLFPSWFSSLEHYRYHMYW